MSNLKKFLTILAITGMIGFSKFDSYAQEVGIVDLDKVGNNYTKAQDLSADLKIKEAELQKFIADAQKQLKDTSSPVDRKNLEDKLSTDYKTKVESYNDFQLKQLKQIDDNVFSAIDQVAKTKKIDLVLNKTSVLQGGVDLTDSVLGLLNAKAPANNIKK